MTDPNEIIRRFTELEAEAGGYAFADHKAIAEKIAAEIGETYEDVRHVLLREWTSPS